MLVTEEDHWIEATVIAVAEEVLNMSYLDRGHDGLRDERARDRDGNLILTQEELRAEYARRAQVEADAIECHRLREERIDAALDRGVEMLACVISDARMRGRRVDAWLAAESTMWFELWFMPGSLIWAWSDLSHEDRFARIQDGEEVPFLVYVYNFTLARILAGVIVDAETMLRRCSEVTR